MPCYCDTPAEENQLEIQIRCKTIMYIDAQKLLTKEQLLECERSNLKLLPMGNVNDHLCKLCKILSKEQMESIPAYYYQIKWAHKTLYNWYLQHLKDDEKYSEDEKS